MKALLSKIGLTPVYTENSLFLMAVAIILLALTNPGTIQEFAAKLAGELADLRLLLAVLLFLAGLGLAVFHAFSKKPKQGLQKRLLLFFAVTANFAVGASAGAFVLETSQGFWAIFPAWNIASAFWLLFAYRLDLINESAVTDGQARPAEVVTGAVILLLIFAVSQYLLNNHWLVTLSICIGYATTLSQLVSRLLRAGT